MRAWPRAGVGFWCHGGCTTRAPCEAQAEAQARDRLRGGSVPAGTLLRKTSVHGRLWSCELVVGHVEHKGRVRTVRGMRRYARHMST